MTLDQILAVVGIVVPLIITMISMHVQNLMRGERIRRNIVEISAQLDTHDERARRLGRRLRRMRRSLRRHISNEITAANRSKTET